VDYLRLHKVQLDSAPPVIDQGLLYKSGARHKRLPDIKPGDAIPARRDPVQIKTIYT